MKNSFFVSREQFFKQLQTGLSEFGLGRSGMAPSSRMSILEALVAALEVRFACWECGPTLISLARCMIFDVIVNHYALKLAT
jgi:hypothetical protein